MFSRRTPHCQHVQLVQCRFIQNSCPFNLCTLLKVCDCFAKVLCIHHILWRLDAQIEKTVSHAERHSEDSGYRCGPQNSVGRFNVVELGAEHIPPFYYTFLGDVAEQSVEDVAW